MKLLLSLIISSIMLNQSSRSKIKPKMAAKRRRMIPHLRPEPIWTSFFR
jgi:hypothetical protein